MFSIPDNLWEQIKTKIPSKKTRRGRPEIDAKKALNAIFYVLKTGHPLESSTTVIWRSKYDSWQVYEMV